MLSAFTSGLQFKLVSDSEEQAICEHAVLGLTGIEGPKTSAQAPAMQLLALLPQLLHKLYPANRYAACHHTAHDWFLENKVRVCACACVRAYVPT